MYVGAKVLRELLALLVDEFGGAVELVERTHPYCLKPVDFLTVNTVDEVPDPCRAGVQLVLQSIEFVEVSSDDARALPFLRASPFIEVE